MSWFGFAGTVAVFYLLLKPTVLGWSSLVAGAAVGFILLGLLDRLIARGVATQTRERVLKSVMNMYFPYESLGEMQVQESASRTYLKFHWQKSEVRVEINRPSPPAARATLRSTIPKGA